MSNQALNPEDVHLDRIVDIACRRIVRRSYYVSESLRRACVLGGRPEEFSGIQAERIRIRMIDDSCVEDGTHELAQKGR